MNTIALKKTLVQLQVKETALVLAMSVILPFLVHLIPPIGGIPLGAIFLPMFYAPLIALILFRPHVALIAGLFSPILNSALTGHPAPEIVGILTFELVIFCIILYLIHRQRRRFRGAAALAYLATLLCASGASGSIDFFLRTLRVSFPGVAMLVLLNIFLLRLQSKEE